MGGLNQQYKKDLKPRVEHYIAVEANIVEATNQRCDHSLNEIARIKFKSTSNAPWAMIER